MLAAMLGFVGVARAQDSEVISLDYTASRGCPDAARFERALAEFTSKVHVGPAGPDARHVEIQVSTQDAHHATGTLTVQGPAASQTPIKRSFQGETCEEVVEAVALGVALVFDPELLGGSAPDPGGTVATPTLEEEPEPKPLEVDGEVDDAVQSGSATAAATAGAEQRERSSHLALTIMAGAELGLGTSVGNAALGLEGRASWGAWRPSAGVELGYGNNFLDGGAALTLEWLPTGRLTLCPHWLEAGSGFSGALCLAGEVGALRSSARSQLETLEPAVRLWGAAAVELKLRWTRAPLSLELKGGMLVPLVEQSYFAVSGSEDELLLRLAPEPACFVALAGLFDLF